MEDRLDRFRSSTLGWLLGTLAGWGTLLLFLAGILLSVIDAGFGLGQWPLLLCAAAAIILLVVWFRSLEVGYAVTEERLIIRRGIFIKSLDEIEMYRIKDVRIDYSLVNQAAGIGTISITSSDETTRDGPLVMRNIARAKQRREELRRLVDSARQRRRVREIDMVQDEF